MLGFSKISRRGVCHFSCFKKFTKVALGFHFAASACGPGANSAGWLLVEFLAFKRCKKLVGNSNQVAFCLGLAAKRQPLYIIWPLLLIVSPPRTCLQRHEWHLETSKLSFSGTLELWNLLNPGTLEPRTPEPRNPSSLSKR